MERGFTERVRRAVKSIERLKTDRPEIGLILGSGLGAFAEKAEGREIPYSQITGFPKTTVPGHKGALKIGKNIAILVGRFHYYEGYSMDDVVLPIFLLYNMGVRTLIITNAAGGVNRKYSPGDLVIIKDHINLMGANPLRGPDAPEPGTRFPDMSEAYTKSLRDLARKAGGEQSDEGVYAGFIGPSYETPAEVRMAEILGADLVGMSTVPEVIAANFLGMKVLGISCVTNMAAGILDAPLSHKEVMETAMRVQPVFTRLISNIVDLLDECKGKN